MTNYKCSECTTDRCNAGSNHIKTINTSALFCYSCRSVDDPINCGASIGSGITALPCNGSCVVGKLFNF